MAVLELHGGVRGGTPGHARKVGAHGYCAPGMKGARGVRAEGMRPTALPRCSQPRYFRGLTLRSRPDRGLGQRTAGLGGETDRTESGGNCSTITYAIMYYNILNVIIGGAGAAAAFWSLCTMWSSAAYCLPLILRPPRFQRSCVGCGPAASRLLREFEVRPELICVLLRGETPADEGKPEFLDPGILMM